MFSHWSVYFFTSVVFVAFTVVVSMLEAILWAATEFVQVAEAEWVTEAEAEAEQANLASFGEAAAVVKPAAG